MRAYELLEYKIDKTIEKFGPALVSQFNKIENRNIKPPIFQWLDSLKLIPNSITL